MKGEPRDKFTWFYQNNPAGPATAFLLKHISPTATGEVVGACGLGTRELMVGGERVTSGLMADFSVDGDHRTVMPALLLQRALCTDALQHYPCAYAFPNSSAVGIFSRIGFQPLGRMRRYMKVLRTRHYLQKRAPYMLAVAAGTAVDILVRSAAMAGRFSGGGRHRVSWVSDVDARFDRFWDRVRRNYRFIGVRDAAFLRWRFVTRPERRASFAVLTDDSGEISAYAALVEKERGIAFIADFLTSTDASLHILLRRVVAALRSRPYHAVTTVFMGPSEIQRVLIAAGLKHRGDAKFVVMGRSPQQAANGAFPISAEDAYLTEADRDN